MGFDKEKCKEALAKSNGDENAALDFLISNS
jgi:translation elongation factor EF-Ts